MDAQQFKGLEVGDVVKHASDRSEAYVVTANYGDRVTAVRTIDMTNPSEWELVSKVKKRTIG